MHHDLRDLGLACGKHRVARLMRAAGLAAQRGYRRRPGVRNSTVQAIAAPNVLARQSAPAAPNQAWVTDITYIRTHEGWLYLSVVIDLFSRQVIGWSMGTRIDRELAINALLMAVWRRQPKTEVLVHSDQGCQFTSHDWQAFLAEHGLRASMSRRRSEHCSDATTTQWPRASFSCSSANASGRRPATRARLRAATCSTTSSCSATQHDATEPTIR